MPQVRHRLDKPVTWCAYKISPKNKTYLFCNVLDGKLKTFQDQRTFLLMSEHTVETRKKMNLYYLLRFRISRHVMWKVIENLHHLATVCVDYTLQLEHTLESLPFLSPQFKYHCLSITNNLNNRFRLFVFNGNMICIGWTDL